MKYLLILFTCFSFGQFNPVFFSATPFTTLTFLDAANTASYPGSGATWTDLKGFQNCTLVSSPTFDSSNGGSIQFNGTSSYGNMGSAFNYMTSDFSFSTWVYVTSLTTNRVGQGPILFFKGEYNVGGYYCQINTAGSVSITTNSVGTPVVSNTGNVITAGNWYNITVAKRNTACNIYINGVLSNTVSGVHIPIKTSANIFTLGFYNSAGPVNYVYSNIRIAKFQAYRKGISAIEVLNNFNTYKSIYGL